MNMFLYLIDGNGNWMTRWHCTSGDSLLLAATMTASLWLFFEYCWYAYQSDLAMKEYASDTLTIQHLREMRNVFVQCGLIHVFNMIVSWFWTPYFAIALFTAYNAWRTRHLNRSKAALLVIEEQRKLHSQLNDVKQIADDAQLATSDDLKQLSFKLQQILERP